MSTTWPILVYLLFHPFVRWVRGASRPSLLRVVRIREPLHYRSLTLNGRAGFGQGETMLMTLAAILIVLWLLGIPPIPWVV